MLWQIDGLEKHQTPGWRHVSTGTAFAVFADVCAFAVCSALPLFSCRAVAVVVLLVSVIALLIQRGSAAQTVVTLNAPDLGCSQYPPACLHGGTCTENSVTDAGITCSCPPGYVGTTCEVDVDACLSRPCLNSATCVDGVEVYSCDCMVGFAGVNCEFNVRDECDSHPCVNNGVCEDLHTSYHCVSRSVPALPNALNHCLVLWFGGLKAVLVYHRRIAMLVTLATTARLTSACRSRAPMEALVSAREVLTDVTAPLATTEDSAQFASAPAPAVSTTAIPSTLSASAPAKVHTPASAMQGIKHATAGRRVLS